MTPQEATRLILEHNIAATELTKKVNFSRRGTGTAQKRLQKAAAKLFQALVGRKPTEAEAMEYEI